VAGIGVGHANRWLSEIDMTVLRFRSEAPSLSSSLISRLRRLTQLSIAEMRRRAASGEPLLEITSFQGDWDRNRVLLAQLAKEIAAGTLPLSVAEVFADAESPMSPDGLRNLLQQFRQIETDTQMHTALELGDITDPSEFEPYDDWTQ
jgi:hypothetical protein